MKNILIPILTDEYKVRVIVGTDEERAKYICKYCKGWDYKSALESCKQTRGSAFNTLPEKHPLLTLNINCPYSQAFGTLAHEASHCFNISNMEI